MKEMISVVLATTARRARLGSGAAAGPDALALRTLTRPAARNLAAESVIGYPDVDPERAAAITVHRPSPPAHSP
jgi:hypothetical protein